MTRRDFERLVEEGAARIPVPFQKHLTEVAVIVESEPTADRKREAGVPLRDELLGLYTGIPRTERAYLPYRLPDTILIFQGPLERLCGGDPECIREEVAHTVWHELGHALGLSERKIRALERARHSRKRKK